MKLIGIIPARYDSSRLEGKVLADINGKPMIWYVYNQLINVTGLDEIIVAIDDDRVRKVCEYYNINYILTSKRHENHIFRLHEVATKKLADYYVCVNGDEPLIERQAIQQVIDYVKNCRVYDVINAITTIKDVSQVVDSSKIKVVENKDGCAFYMSRSPVPYPKGLNCNYKRYVGIEAFTPYALETFTEKRQTDLECIEDIDHLRFIENKIPIRLIDVNSNSFSVDIQKDLERVRMILR